MVSFQRSFRTDCVRAHSPRRTPLRSLCHLQRWRRPLAELVRFINSKPFLAAVVSCCPLDSFFLFIFFYRAYTHTLNTSFSFSLRMPKRPSPYFILITSHLQAGRSAQRSSCTRLRTPMALQRHHRIANGHEKGFDS